MITALFVAACILVLTHVFKRLVKMDRQVLEGVRWSVLLYGGLVFWSAYLMLKGWQPDAYHALLMWAIAFSLSITSRRWREGVPSFLRKADAEPRMVKVPNYAGHDRRVL